VAFDIASNSVYSSIYITYTIHPAVHTGFIRWYDIVCKP